ncbi:MAG TPA: hypothetical protein VMY05_10155 [Acidobacteriota bacterium]|nr:hypothetical protein [Acidobacteriota bacterium]
MKPKNIFKIFQKGSKAASRAKKKCHVESKWPSGIRIGIYGHTNTGKTVYLTVLNEDCKISKKLQIAVSDTTTAGELLANYRSIWGLGISSEVGTVVDLRGEKKFPEATTGHKTLLFNAILDRSSKMPVVALDYDGKAVSISEQSDLKDKVEEFMAGCDGILVFYDPKMLGAEWQTQECAASFSHMLEQLAPLHRRLPVPVGLVVTKADILPGFTGDNETVLINPEDENFLSQDFETFLERVLASDKLTRNQVWAGTVRDVLVKLQEFLKAVIGRTLNFQIFFISSTGQPPEKIGTEIGRSIYQPPKKMTPIGVKEPMYWLLHAIKRNRRVSRLGAVARVVTYAAVIWIAVCSLPYLYHFKFLLPRTYQVEERILDLYEGNPFNMSAQERTVIGTAYRRYQNSLAVRWMFPGFTAPAQRKIDMYREFDLGEGIKRLDGLIVGFTTIVSDTLLWPKVNPSNDSLMPTQAYDQLMAQLEAFHKGEETSILFARSGRVLQYRDLFHQAIIQRDDTTYWNTIKRQVQQDQSLYAKQISPAEKQFGAVLMQYELDKVKEVIAETKAFEMSDLIDRVNGYTDPRDRLEKAVNELQDVLSQLAPSDVNNRNTIRTYLRAAESWFKRRAYTCKVETLPGQDHLHIEVTDNGADPTWSELNQIFQGDETKIIWEPGRDIHIALDTLGHNCQLGKDASEKITLSKKYCLFEMEGDLSFDNTGRKINVRFKPSLSEQLPALK